MQDATVDFLGQRRQEGGHGNLPLTKAGQAIGLRDAKRAETRRAQAKSLGWERQSEALKAVAVPFALTRVLLLALTGTFALLRGQSPLAIWNQLDSRWYLGIATHGYQWSLDGKPALAFFPLYPSLLHLIPRLGPPVLLGAMMVSSLAFFGALLYLYYLTCAEWGPQVAKKSVWLLALFPTAFFTFAAYSEGLWLLAATGALYHARRRQALRAGLWTAAALLTRSTGVILLPALLILVWSSTEPRNRTARSRILRLHSIGGPLPRLLLALSPPALATVIYAVYLTAHHLPPLGMFHSQRLWHRGFAPPWTGFFASAERLPHYAVSNPAWAFEDVLQLLVTVLFLVLTVRMWNRLDTAMKAYCAAFWALVLCTPEWLDGFYAPFNSMDRFVLALFPLGAWVAAQMPTTRFRVVLGGFATLLVGSAAVHLAGGWVG